jgi:ribose transport system substrate-binding protein
VTLVRGGSASWTRIALAMTMLALAGFVLAGCGEDEPSGSGSAGSGSSGGEDPAVADAKKKVDELYAGTWQDPPAEGPDAVKGKNAWFISCGQAFEPCADQVSAFKEAAKALGWKVTIVDGNASPTIAADAIDQAVSAGADAVGLAAFDCSAIKNALKKAKDAGVFVVNTYSADCDEEQPGEEPLFGATLQMAGYPKPVDFYRAWDAAKAEYLIAKTGGKAKVIDLVSINQFIHREGDKAFRKALAKCEQCEVVETVNFTFDDIGKGKYPQMIQSALLKHPDANALFVPYDALYGLGVVDALKQSGRKVVTLGGEGFAPNMDLIRNGTQTASLALSFEWSGYGAADVMNRLFADEKPEDLPNQGMGWQFVDKEHNLPAEGAFKPDVDYAAAYEKVWSGQ